MLRLYLGGKAIQMLLLGLYLFSLLGAILLEEIRYWPHQDQRKNVA